VETYSHTKPLMNHQLVRLDVGADSVVAFIWKANTKYRKVTAAPAVMKNGRKEKIYTNRVTNSFLMYFNSSPNHTEQRSRYSYNDVGVQKIINNV